ncbi:ATP-grasp domain-containing protein [Arcobacter sp.]|uniref:ATP-grasp domain-containing protein n=1 Tax=Arcobacter sp. TaxID=1872629 RepID=UPI003C75BEF0
MIKKNILITSAGVATAVNVISSLRKSTKFTFNIIAIDMNKNSVGLYLADKFYIVKNSKDNEFLPGLIKILKDENIEFIFPLHSSEIAFFSSNIAIFEKLHIGIIIPSEKVVKTCINKNLFEKFLEKNNFPYPKTYKNENEINTYPIFIKLKQGSSSIGAFKINSKEELNFYLKNNKHNYLIQEYINWDEITIDCYVNKNNILVGFVPRYRIKVKDGKSVVAKTMFSEKLQSIITILLKKLKYKGACNIQVFYNNDEIKIIELNPRLSAGGLPLTTQAGVNIPELMIEDYFGKVENKILSYNQNLTMYRYLSEVFV